MYVILHKEQHAIMESITDYGNSGMDNGTKVHHFLQGIKCTELEAAVNVVQTQPEKYGTDFDATISGLNGHKEWCLNAICPYCNNWNSASEA